MILHFDSFASKKRVGRTSPPSFQARVACCESTLPSARPRRLCGHFNNVATSFVDRTLVNQGWSPLGASKKRLGRRLTTTDRAPLYFHLARPRFYPQGFNRCAVSVAGLRAVDRGPRLLHERTPRFERYARGVTRYTTDPPSSVDLVSFERQRGALSLGIGLRRGTIERRGCSWRVPFSFGTNEQFLWSWLKGICSRNKWFRRTCSLVVVSRSNVIIFPRRIVIRRASKIRIWNSTIAKRFYFIFEIGKSIEASKNFVCESYDYR